MSPCDSASRSPRSAVSASRRRAPASGGCESDCDGRPAAQRATGIRHHYGDSPQPRRWCRVANVRSPRRHGKVSPKRAGSASRISARQPAAGWGLDPRSSRSSASGTPAAATSPGVSHSHTNRPYRLTRYSCSVRPSRSSTMGTTRQPPGAVIAMGSVSSVTAVQLARVRPFVRPRWAATSAARSSSDRHVGMVSGSSDSCVRTSRKKRDVVPGLTGDHRDAVVGRVVARGDLISYLACDVNELVRTHVRSLTRRLRATRRPDGSRDGRPAGASQDQRSVLSCPRVPGRAAPPRTHSQSP